MRACNILSLWLVACCVLAARTAAAQPSKEASEGDIVVASTPEAPGKPSDGSDILVYSSSGGLKASVHIPFSTGDANPSLGISGNAEYAIYGSSSTNGNVAIIQIAGGTPKYIGKFSGGPGLLQTTRFPISQIASGSVSSDGSGYFFVSQGVGSKACPLSSQKSIATQVVEYRFTPARNGKAATLTADKTFDVYRSTKCSDATNVVLGLRTIGDNLYAVLEEQPGTYTMRSFNAFSAGQQKASAPIVTYSASQITAVTIDSPTSFVAQGLKPNVEPGYFATQYQLRIEKGKNVVYATSAPGAANSNSARLYAGGLSSYTNGGGIIAATGALNNRGYGPVGNSIYKFDAKTVANPQKLFTIAPNAMCQDLVVVPKSR